MKQINKQLILMENDDLNWNFDEKNIPFYYLKPNNRGYGISEYVDPFPCYHHDIKLVDSEIERINKIINLPNKPIYYIFSHEPYSRCNGHASSNDEYVGNKGESKLNPYIVLCGKRIPLHPAMTKYLTSHEIGHVIDWTLEKILKLERDEFRKMYAKDVRNMEYCDDYGGLKWSNNTGEILANDIRIVLFNSESEFWPHNVEHPSKCKNVIDYWNNINKTYFNKKE